MSAPHIKNLIQHLVDSCVIDGELAEAWNRRVQQQAAHERTLRDAQAGNVKAMAKVGFRFLYGKHGVRQDDEAGYEWLCKAHQGGSVWGTGHVGLCLLEGWGVTKNRVGGMVCLTQAAVQGSDWAAYKLGMAHALGLYGLPVNHAEAIPWLRKSLNPSCAHKSMSKAAKAAARKKLQILLLLTSDDE